MERNIILRPHAPWYNNALRAAKQEKRRRERKYKSSGLTVHKELYKEQCQTYTTMLKDAKTSYHRKEIENAEQKDLFRVIDKLSVPKDEIKLPSHKSPGELANRFSDYFHQKIQTLRQRLDTTAAAYFVDDLAVPCSTSFTSFSEVSEDDLLEVIRSSTVTSCNLDPLPRVFSKIVLILYCLRWHKL